MKPRVMLSWILQFILTGILGLAGWMKLSGDPQSQQLFQSLGMDPGGRYVIGILEILTACLLLRSCTAARGAFLSLCIMTGALIAHATRIGFLGDQSELTVMWTVAFTCSVLIVGLRKRELRFLANALDR